MRSVASDLLTATVLFAPRLAAGLLVAVAFWVAGRVLRAAVGRFLASHLDPSVVALLCKSLQFAAIGLGVITALGTIGINVSALVAGLGLTGFALGFALKDLVANVVAGVLVLVYRPFRREDHVAVAGFEGTVREIDLRYTTLETPEQIILIPNQTLLANAVTISRGPARKPAPPPGPPVAANPPWAV
jgi:small-conductance mechanosensitive channel